MTIELHDEGVRPRTIHADRPARQLRIEWDDGHTSVFDFSALRWLCPCAFCRGEAGQPGWLDSAPTLTQEQTELVDASLVGHYAVKPVWADGHATGFYTFEHLRRNCPCPEHRARREAAAAMPGEGPAHAHEAH